MNLRNRQRLLSLAKLLERMAARLRKYVASKTPRRPRKAKESA